MTRATGRGLADDRVDLALPAASDRSLARLTGALLRARTLFAVATAAAQFARSAIPDARAALFWSLRLAAAKPRALRCSPAPGETLEKVAALYTVRPEWLVRWNPGLALDRPLQQGTLLHVETDRPGERRVRRCITLTRPDSWDSLARSLGIDSATLRAYNPHARDLLRVGEVVTYFAREPSEPASSGVRAVPEVNDLAFSRGKPTLADPIDQDLAPFPFSPYYDLRCPAHAFASSHTIDKLLVALTNLRGRYDGQIIVGDLSREPGGAYGHHASHQTGRDVDIWLPVLGGCYRATPRGVRATGGRDRREHRTQRRSDPPRRRAAHGAALTSTDPEPQPRRQVRETQQDQARPRRRSAARPVHRARRRDRRCQPAPHRPDLGAGHPVSERHQALADDGRRREAQRHHPRRRHRSGDRREERAPLHHRGQGRRHPRLGGNADRRGDVPHRGGDRRRGRAEDQVDLVLADEAARVLDAHRRVGRVVEDDDVGLLSDLVALFDVELPADNLPAPSWNIAPTDPVSIVLDSIPKAADDDIPVRRLEAARWGLVPGWAKDPKVGVTAFNARIETLGEKAHFKNAIRKRRAIVPATGYYEWHTVGDIKTPHFIHLPDGELFTFAGLYEWWRNPAAGDDAPDKWLLSTTIITRAATGNLASIHDRMPLSAARADR